jgi:hypothetical protein
MQPSLSELQQTLHAAIVGQDVDLPTSWFDGPPERAALGISAHATTIRHARAEALGQSFPRTLEYLGGELPGHVEAYFEEMGPTRLLPQELGQGFADFLARREEPSAARIAAAEWAVLCAYHAPDRQCLAWDRFRSMEYPLDLQIALHPAAAIVPVGPETLRIFGIVAPGRDRLLITRPTSEVRLRAVDSLAGAMAAAIGTGNRLRDAAADAIAGVQDSQEAIFAAFADLVSAGALMLAGEADFE